MLRVIALVLLLASTASAAPIVSDFSSDVDGWTHVGATVFQQNASGGNPGGFLYIDNGEGVITYIIAPAKFRGALSGYNGGTISFDGKMLGIGGSGYNATNDYGHLVVSGSAGMAVADLLPGTAPNNTPPQNAWATFSSPFTAAAFGVSEQQWSAILADVTDVRLSVEALFGNEIQGVDNFQITPEPSVALLLALGLCAAAHRRKRG